MTVADTSPITVPTLAPNEELREIDDAINEGNPNEVAQETDDTINEGSPSTHALHCNFPKFKRLNITVFDWG